MASTSTRSRLLRCPVADHPRVDVEDVDRRRAIRSASPSSTPGLRGDRQTTPPMSRAICRRLDGPPVGARAGGGARQVAEPVGPARQTRHRARHRRLRAPTGPSRQQTLRINDHLVVQAAARPELQAFFRRARGLRRRYRARRDRCRRHCRAADLVSRSPRFRSTSSPVWSTPALPTSPRVTTASRESTSW